MLPSFATQVSLLIIHPSKVTDSRNNHTLDYGNPDHTVAAWGWLNPAATAKTKGGTEVSSDSHDLYLPEGTDISSVCAVDVLEGPLTGRYLADGEPRRWKSPTGRLSHVHVTVKRWTPEEP